MKKTTILTVCYNAENTIEKTIQSVISQTYSNIEYVIVDGRSSDKTLNIINQYRQDNFVILSEPDQGIYDAINKGLELASGDYLLILGADDCLADKYVIEKITCYFTEEVIYYGNIYRMIRKDVYCGRFNSFKLAVKNIPHQALFYPKNIYKSKKYKVKYKLFADYVYNMELWKKHTFKYIPVLVTKYYDGASSSTLLDVNFDVDYKQIVIKNLGHIQYYYSSIYHCLRNMIKKRK